VSGCHTSVSGAATARLGDPNNPNAPRWFNSACFTAPPDFTFGDEPRVDSRLRSKELTISTSPYSKEQSLPPTTGWASSFERSSSTFSIERSSPAKYDMLHRQQQNFGVVTSTASGTNPRLIHSD